MSAHETKLIAFQKTLKETRTKLHITLALPALLYGSENWGITARDAREMTTAALGQTIKQTHSAKELNITPVLGKIQEYRKNRLEHVNKMPRLRLVRILKTADQQAEETIGYH
jgi:hypothetical protein